MIRYLHDEHQRSFGEIQALVQEYARVNGLTIPPDIDRRLTAAINRERGRATVVDVHPDGATHDVIGRVMGIELRVNLFQRVGYEDNPFGRAFLGKLAKETYSSLTVRENPDPITGIAPQFIVLVPSKSVAECGVKKDSLVFVTLTPAKLPNDEWIWLGSELALVNQRP